MDKMMKLQNILFPKNELIQHWHMFYRGDRFSHNIYESAHCLKKDQQTEFFTYFNAFSLEKWKKYTAIDHAYLQLKVKGTLGIQLFGHYMNNNIIENVRHRYRCGRGTAGRHCLSAGSPGIPP